jgi:KaiC/GvpD/RAD55 family RecA-like ATPase
MAKSKTATAPTKSAPAPATVAPAPAAPAPQVAPPAVAQAPVAPAAPMMPQGYGMPMPGMPGMPMMQPGQQNPMLQMFSMLQMMSSGMTQSLVDPSAMPFAAPVVPATAAPEADKGLEAGVIRPARLTNRIKGQEAVALGSVLDYLCLTPDGQHALGGIPKGCTIAFAGPPGTSKTRTMLAALAKVALTGEKVAFVVAEEGFHDAKAGRDDLCSRLCKIGMAVTGLDEAKFEKQVLENFYVVEAQYHKGTTWDDFVSKYRYLIEQHGVKFVVIDSLNMLDPARTRTADNLSALKTYNHEAGATCVCIGQIRDTGEAVGGEALAHTADVFILLEKMSLGSKEIAAVWGGQYRDQIDVIHARKSVTTPKFEHPVRVSRDANGVLIVHPAQPAQYALLTTK